MERSHTTKNTASGYITLFSSIIGTSELFCLLSQGEIKKWAEWEWHALASSFPRI
jgi:hypothetical protein